MYFIDVNTAAVRVNLGYTMKLPESLKILQSFLVLLPSTIGHCLV